jgi:hypothetical protein
LKAKQRKRNDSQSRAAQIPTRPPLNSPQQEGLEGPHPSGAVLGSEA